MVIDEIINGVISLANKYIPDPQERDKFALEIAQIEASQQQAQADIDKAEATSGSLFIGGWRPFIGWICGAALCYHFILQPLIVFIAACMGNKIELPIFNMDALNTILMGMLGLGTMRSFEKIKGVTK